MNKATAAIKWHHRKYAGWFASKDNTKYFVSESADGVESKVSTWDASAREWVEVGKFNSTRDGKAWVRRHA